MSATPRGLAAWFVSLFLGIALVGVVRAQDPGDTPPPPPQPPGQEVQTRGPVHESFAQPVVYDPKPGQVIPQPPPDPIEEMPPDQKPEGGNVQWIPGYWAWDDARRDYLWISGVWRNIPPGRQWNPGYWHRVDGGVQWVSGTWTPIQSQQAQYLPTPPANIEAGPNSPEPMDGAVWAPGCWMWSEARYVWRPGFWVPPQPNWVWVPAQYVWTPGGYLFCEGYWDRPFATRGLMFAPVYFSQPVYAQPAFVFQPSITIAAGGLMASLFVRPSFGAYYFGDYYAPGYVGIGIYPWFSFHQSRFGYDPMFAYYSATYARANPAWVAQQREAFLFRREHLDARPPHTYAEMVRVTSITRINNTTIVNNNIRNVAFAQPVSRLAAAEPARFARVEAAEQRRVVAQTQQVQRFQQERARREVALASHAASAPNRPRSVELPRSPIAAAHPAAVAAHTPPSAPAHPALDHAAQPLAPGRTAQRPEAHPEATHATPARPALRSEAVRKDQKRALEAGPPGLASVVRIGIRVHRARREKALGRRPSPF